MCKFAKIQHLVDKNYTSLLKITHLVHVKRLIFATEKNILTS